MSLGKKLKDKLNKISETVNNNVSNVLETAKKVTEDVLTAADDPNLPSFISDGVKNKANDILSDIGKAENTVKNINSAISNVKNFTDSIDEKISDVARNAIERTCNAIEDDVKKVQNVANNIAKKAEDLQNYAVDAFNKVTEKPREALNKIANGAKAVFSLGKTIVNGAIDVIAEIGNGILKNINGGNNSLTKGSVNIGDKLLEQKRVENKTNNLPNTKPKIEGLNDEVFDNLPHIRKSVDNKTFMTYASKGYGNEEEAGGIDLLSTFQKTRTGVETGVDYAETGICYAFITKPDLNLTKNLKAENYTVAERNSKISSDGNSALYNTLQNGFIEYVARNYPDIIDSLTCNDSNKQSFIPLLFNYFRGMTLEDHSLAEGTYSETFRGYNQKLPTTAAASFSGGSLSITYDEIRPALVTFLHKVWFEYMEGVKFNTMTPSMDTINRRELDYTSSLYYFLMAPDGETIDFWAKYTGIFPQNVPYSSFSSGDITSRNLIQLQVSYVYNFKEFLDPAILIDFNDTFMNSSDIMTAQAHYKGDILSVDDMDEFQSKLINMTNGASYDPGSKHSIGLRTMSDTRSSYIYQKSGSNLEKRSFKNVGVFKKDEKYKLLFYN